MNTQLYDLGLRFSPALSAELFRGVVSMKESSTYQASLAEGQTEGAITEAKRLLRRFGDGILGPPDAQTAASIEQIHDLTRLEDLCDRLRTATNWQELLALPASAPRGRRRRT